MSNGVFEALKRGVKIHSFLPLVLVFTGLALIGVAFIFLSSPILIILGFYVGGLTGYILIVVGFLLSYFIAVFVNPDVEIAHRVVEGEDE